MCSNFRDFYTKVFSEPLKVDELTQKHLPSYSYFDKVVSANTLSCHSNEKATVIYTDNNLELKQPKENNIEILPYQDISDPDFFDSLQFSDYIFNSSPYAYVNSKCINSVVINLPYSINDTLKLQAINSFVGEAVGKKTYTTKKNSFYSIEEIFELNEDSMLANDFLVAENASVNFVANLEGIKANQTSLSYLFVLNNNSIVNFYLLGLGSGSMFINIYAIIKGIGAQCKIAGSCLGKKNDETVLISYINHRVPKNISNVHINNVLMDKSKNFFLGLIKVEKEGQAVDAYEVNRNLVLSKEARTFSIPKLEIENNNLRCSHSSSITSVDEEILFYLNSRGIDYQNAVKLVSYGFLREPFPPSDRYDGIIEKALNSAFLYR